jgi:hypothetical protein
MRTLFLWAGAACAVLFLLSGLVAGGPAGVLLALGTMVLLLGLGALALGRARWARIGGRRTAGLVAAAGLVVTVAASAMLPTPKTTVAVAPAVSTPSTAPASLAADEAAIETAENELAAAEAAAATGTSDVGTGSLLGQTAADSAVQKAAASAPTSALAALATIPVKGRAPMTGYSRDQFGTGWVDTDHDGCDTRNDVLARDLTGDTVKPGTHDCVVLTGTLADPYSGRTIAFQRGASTSTAVQIDHVVALSDAWQTGAQQWDAVKRTAFANVLRELLAVDGPLNEQKGDGDAATWLPPNKDYRCAYVARQVAVKATYGLWMTQAEKNASATVLATCPTMTLPDGVAVALPQTAVETPVPTTTPRTTTAAPRTTTAAPRTTTAPRPTTAAPTTAAAPAGKTVSPGAFCSPEGATGVTSKGTAMVCKTSATDTRARWRSAG